MFVTIADSKLFVFNNMSYRFIQKTIVKPKLLDNNNKQPLWPISH